MVCIFAHSDLNQSNFYRNSSTFVAVVVTSSHSNIPYGQLVLLIINGAMGSAYLAF